MPRVRSGVLGLGLTFLLLPSPASAGTFTVSNTDDSGVGSLRQAILDANLAADVDTIVFTLPASSTITLTSSLVDLTNDVTFDATGAPDLTIDGGGGQILGIPDSDATLIDVGSEMGSIEIGDEDTLTFTANNDFEVSADIADDMVLPATGASLVKEGTATLTLSGDNSFTGSVTVNAGTLVGDTDSLNVDITNDAAVVFDQDDDDSYSGVISGSGSFEKSGDANLTLSGANTFTGTTTISDGTLTLDDTGALAGAVVNDAELAFDQAAVRTFASDISGTGVLTKKGVGELTLTGSNSYTGGTSVEMGTLVGDTNAIQGDVSIEAGATLAFEQADDGSFSGVIDGAGEVEKRGVGSVRMTGSNLYTGGTTVAGGELIVDTDSLPGDATIEALGTLVFDQGGDGIFSGDLSGAGSLEKRGSGVLELSGVTNSVGDTDIAKGTLDLSGMLMSTIHVGSAGTLAGNGSVTGAVSVDGALSPGGDDEDDFDVDGAVSFEAGSSFVVDVNDSDGGDTLLATGVATIDPGATLVIRPATGDYSGGSSVTLLDASGLASLDEFSLGEPFLFLDRVVGYDMGAGTVQLTLTLNATNIDDVGETANQRAVGAALANPILQSSTDPEIMALFKSLEVLTVSQGGAALDALSGEALSAGTSARQALSERLQRTLHRRMRSVLFSSEKAWPAGAPAGPAPRRSAGPTDVAAPPRYDEAGVGAWFDGYGIFGNLDGDENAGDVDYSLYGGTAGVDFRLGDHALAGLAAGYARSDLEIDDRDTDGDVDTVQGAAYLAYASPRIYAGVSGRYAWSQSDTEREIDIGAISSRARADFDSHDYGARVETALHAFEAGNVAFQPLASFEWSRFSRESFEETGAGSLGLDVDSEKLDTAQLQLGGRIQSLIDIGQDAVLAPELRAYWIHEFGDRERKIEAALGGVPFTVEGVEAPRDGALFGMGWSMSIGRNVRATADYDVRWDSARLEHTGSVTLRLRF